jgi:two-component system chemotaxis response regulator CheB
MEAEKKRLAAVVTLNSNPPVNGHRPSVDVLFSSIAKIYGERTLAVIMTGMGKDGAREIGEIRKAGGITVAQDQKSSVVFGMPKVAYDNGFIQHIVPLKEISGLIGKIVKENR